MVSKSSSTGGNKPSNNSVNTNNMVRIKAMNNPNNKRSPQPPEGANYPM